MALYFPQPYPDEPLAGVIARASRHLGLPPKVLAKKVLGCEWGEVSIHLPLNLARVSELTQTSPEELIAGHTFLPYVTAFMPSGIRSFHRFEALQGVGRFASLFGSMARARQPLRHCPVCCAADEATYGESYWHRSHLLPAALVCAQHGCNLVESISHTLFAARTLSANPAAEPSRTSRLAWLVEPHVALELAKKSAQTLSQDWQPKEAWAPLHRELAMQAGYAAGERALSSVHLALDFSVFYGNALLDGLRCPMVKKTLSGSWPACMLRPGVREPFSTLKHVLLSTFLDLHTSSSPYRRRRPGPRPTETMRLDYQTAAAVQFAWKQAEKNETQIGTTDLLEQLQMWSKFRHDRSKYPMTRSAVARLQSSPQSLRMKKV